MAQLSAQRQELRRMSLELAGNQQVRQRPCTAHALGLRWPAASAAVQA